MTDKKYIVVAPVLPGHPPSVDSEHDTLAAARARAVAISRGQRWLRGQDVRIERPDGQLVEYAGAGG